VLTGRRLYRIFSTKGGVNVGRIRSTEEGGYVLIIRSKQRSVYIEFGGERRLYGEN